MSRAFLQCAASLTRIVWAVSIVTAAIAAGAYMGWQSHRSVGALALGFVGPVAGGFLSSPSVIMQILS
ncbi:hypothetical protein C0075_17775 [Rhizobium sp. KAs_5_22]|nr:hypothetical protein C0075_17775 [Rhizobium sp. KAs_5_22]